LNKRKINRRHWMAMALGAGAMLGLGTRLASGEDPGPLLRRPIPSSGEKIPVVGLGSSATFRSAAAGEDVYGLREVLRILIEGGGTVFDTAPSYGASEEVAGRLARELGITRKLFWATKANVAPRGAGAEDPAAARVQIAESFRRLGVETMYLIQVHNLADVSVQLGSLKELKTAKRVRYIGVTSTSKEQYGELARVMRDEPIDFIGVDYAIDNRSAEETILPLAVERKIAVMVYVPFGRTRLSAGPPRRDRRDAGRQQGDSHGRQPAGRDRARAGRDDAPAHGGLHGRAPRGQRLSGAGSVRFRFARAGRRHVGSCPSIQVCLTSRPSSTSTRLAR
jgi:aryl-alcohol dehydrogenase-like predicted oxidoreductase